MQTIRFNQLRTILCLGAHSDDIEIGCGGALLRLLAESPQAVVHWVVLGAGGERSAEAKASAGKFLGDRLNGAANAHRVVVSEFPDSYFPYSGDAIKRFFAELRQTVSPDLVFTHRLEDRHQDHRLTAELTWNTFRDHPIVEYEIPKYEGDLGGANFYITLERAICQRKVDLLCESFPSQQIKPWFTDDLFWGLLRLRGAECNSPTRFAEAFHCRKLVM